MSRKNTQEEKSRQRRERRRMREKESDVSAWGQKRAPDLITAGCEPPCGCRGIELRTFGRAGNALNHCAISPAPSRFSYITQDLPRDGTGRGGLAFSCQSLIKKMPPQTCL